MLVVWQQQCDKQRLSLDAGVCDSPSKGFQHLNIRGVVGAVAAPLPDERESMRVNATLCIFSRKGTVDLHFGLKSNGRASSSVLYPGHR